MLVSSFVRLFVRSIARFRVRPLIIYIIYLDASIFVFIKIFFYITYTLIQQSFFTSIIITIGTDMMSMSNIMSRARIVPPSAVLKNPDESEEATVVGVARVVKFPVVLKTLPTVDACY